MQEELRLLPAAGGIMEGEACRKHRQVNILCPIMCWLLNDACGRGVARGRGARGKGRALASTS